MLSLICTWQHILSFTPTLITCLEKNPLSLIIKDQLNQDELQLHLTTGIYLSVAITIIVLQLRIIYPANIDFPQVKSIVRRHNIHITFVLLHVFMLLSEFFNPFNTSLIITCRSLKNENKCIFFRLHLIN